MRNIEKFLQRAVDRQELAGVNLLVLKNGKEVLYAQAGYADREAKKPYDRDCIQRMYSMSKPLTGAAVMLLMERGIISINQNVSDFLPGFKDQVIWKDGETVPVRRPAYIRDLLSMTSGLVYGYDEAGKDDMAAVKTQEIFHDIASNLHTDHQLGTVEIANRLGKAGLAFQPGDAWRYGTSADVLGAVIEVAAGMPFGEFLQKELFDPLGMTDTGFYVPVDKQDRLAQAYRVTDDGLVLDPTENLGLQYLRRQKPAFESGGAGITSTLDDYAKFATMLMNKGTYQGKQILSEKTVEFFTQGRLAPWQEDYMWRTWDSLLGYSYGNLLRHNIEPGMNYMMTEKDEYGWDGWLGTFFANCPKSGLTILMGQQTIDAGGYPFMQTFRNVLAQESFE